MKKGIKVTSYVIGVLNAIEEDSVLIEVGGGTKLRYLKTAITDVNPNKHVKKEK